MLQPSALGPSLHASYSCTLNGKELSKIARRRDKIKAQNSCQARQLFSAKLVSVGTALPSLLRAHVVACLVCQVNPLPLVTSRSDTLVPTTQSSWRANRAVGVVSAHVVGPLAERGVVRCSSKRQHPTSAPHCCASLHRVCTRALAPTFFSTDMQFISQTWNPAEETIH